MFNRLINGVFTLYNRVIGKSEPPIDKPEITEVILFPNPIDMGQTYLIQVKVEVVPVVEE